MKKILSLFVLLGVLASCEEDVKFNNPAVQGLKDNELWKASEFSAILSGSSLTIEATNGFETVILQTNGAEPGQYELGVDEANRATYMLSVDGIEETYRTGADMGNGLIEILEKDTKIEGNTRYISGKFYFNAVDESEENVVNYQNGVFFRVPLTVEQ